VKGSLESFALEEVIQAIIQTKKIGRIDIDGSHGQYIIYLNRDSIYHAVSPHYERGINAVYEAFIEHKGNFEFKEMLSSKYITISKPVFDIIAEGISLKDELKEINSKIFSDTTFELSQDVNLNEISLQAQDLKFLITIGKGLKTEDILKTLNLDYFDFLRKVKEFVSLGLIKIK